MQSISPRILCISLAAALLSGAFAVIARAEQSGDALPALYRVEVIVFTHDSGDSDRHISDTPEAFAAPIDPLWEARTRETPGLAGRLPPPLEDLEAGPDAGPVLPPLFLPLETWTVPMDDAWRRLADSPRYTPVTRLAWHQTAGRNAATPRVRIHDDTMLDYDPFATRPSTTSNGPASRAANPATDDATETPEPLSNPAYYRLDGHVRLYRRQYYHIAMELVWQTPVMRMQTLSVNAPLEPTAWGVHRLSSSRTVQTDRLEYFDSAWLGALVRVTRWQPPADTVARDPGSSAD